jgi:hypothetical protein
MSGWTTGHTPVRGVLSGFVRCLSRCRIGAFIGCPGSCLGLAHWRPSCGPPRDHDGMHMRGVIITRQAACDPPGGMPSPAIVWAMPCVPIRGATVALRGVMGSWASLGLRSLVRACVRAWMNSRGIVGHGASCARPPRGSNPVAGGGCSYPPLPTNFLPFRNVAHNATTTRASPTTTLTP